MDDSIPTRTLTWREQPLRELVRLAWPIAVSHISFSVMTAVDTMFVGHLGPEALAGVALGGITAFTLLCFGIGLLRATKLASARAVGAGKPEVVNAYLGAALWLALGGGVAFALLGQLGAQLLPLLTRGEASGRIAAQFASLRMWAAPIVLVTAALREARYALGSTRAPMIATLIANIANAGLVVLFLFGFDGGVAAVAWATTVAQVIEAAILIYLQRERGFGLRLWTRAELRLLLHLGVPLGIERFFDVASFSVMVALFARMGDVELAAHQVANQALLFAFMPSMAIGEAACVLLGQALGAKSWLTIPRVQRAALAASYAYAATCSLTLLGLGPFIARAFTQDAVVIARASELLRVAAIFMGVLPLYQIGQSSLRALGDVRVAALITVIAAWGCTPLIGALLGFGLGLGAVGGWIGIGVELALAALCFWLRLRRGTAWLSHAQPFEPRASVPA